jgi:mediator of RNA polymerase II transcription subunit 12
MVRSSRHFLIPELMSDIVEIPPDAKLVAYDPFRNYPQISSSDLPIDMPSEYRSQLRYLLPHSIPNTAVADLMSAHRDATGALVPSGPLVNRPWEWVENLGEPATLDPKEEAKEREEKERLKTRYLVKNSGSLSLDAFLARVTGDGVISGYDDPREDANVRSFEDGLSAESVFKRDWRETRVYPDGCVLPTRSGARGEEDGGSSSTGLMRPERRPPRTSPASSVFSRASGQASGTGSSLSLRTSPGQPRGSSPSASEPIDVDAIFTANAGGTTASRSEKRKAEAVSDDEIEIVEGPVNIKTRPKAAKYRSKKR